MRVAPCCRDRGRGWADEGALCLSSDGYDMFASGNPDDSYSHEDRHKAPALPNIRPLSLQHRGRIIADCSCENSSE